MVKIFIKKTKEKTIFFEINETEVDSFIAEAIEKGYKVKDQIIDNQRVVNITQTNSPKSLKEAIELL